ncbi:hypothetical protein Taro_005696 [Colocasia esculenta]|uniref:Uncharacterized protein n=1 Tax=Colocasia esculenta TaxID=4460 RepID=A0A843TVA5_COLES|nr:hypothetical protein [Colocasia esculenta]
MYAPHLVGTKRLKANRFMDGLRPMFIKKLGPHNRQTYTQMVQRAQLVEDTMAKNNNKRPTIGKDYGMEKKIKVEETTTVEQCKFCDKPEHQADKCWNKAGACLRWTSFRTCWGHVEELLVAGELWIDHNKPILFLLFVCYDHCKPSPWSQPKASGCDSRAWYHTAQGRRDPMKGICIPGHDLGVDQVHASRGFTRRLGVWAALKHGVRP